VGIKEEGKWGIKKLEGKDRDKRLGGGHQEGRREGRVALGVGRDKKKGGGGE